MAIIPGESIFEAAKLKPATFRVWCLLCEVRNAHLGDCYLTIEKAQQAGIHKTAYYEAFAELKSLTWISFSGKRDGKQWWKLLKGFASENSANAEKQKEKVVENSANAEKGGVNQSANAENSANAEKSGRQNSANAENPPDPLIRNIVPSEESQDSNESFDISRQGNLKGRKFSNKEMPERLFEFWKRRMNVKRAVFTDDRKTKAAKALEIFGYADCIRAVIGCSRSDWHMGRDPDNSTLYNEFERIFKKPEETEKFIRRHFKRMGQNNPNFQTSNGGLNGNGKSYPASGNGSGNKFDVIYEYDYSEFASIQFDQ